MANVTRRSVLALGAAAVAAPSPAADEPAKQDKGSADRKHVMAAGMTEAEADCWETIARAAGQFFALPKLHPLDGPEVAQAIHIVQNKLLSRPTYRKYLEEAKKAASK